MVTLANALIAGFELHRSVQLLTDLTGKCPGTPIRHAQSREVCGTAAACPSRLDAMDEKLSPCLIHDLVIYMQCGEKFAISLGGKPTYVFRFFFRRGFAGDCS